MPTPSPTPKLTPTQVAVQETPAAALKVSLPADDGPHLTNTEWWYYNGHLEGEDGSRYGFHYVFFKFGGAFLLGQFALTDHQLRTFTHDLRFAPATEDGPADGFRAAVSDWEMSGFAGEFDLEASLADYAIELHLSSEKAAALHGGDGLVEFQVTGDSFYYSYTRLRVTGDLTDHGVTKRVTGSAWMDHQWGDFETGDLNWDWFSLQLQDNTEVMLFEVRDREGKTLISFGTYVDAGGNAIPMSEEDFTVRATGTWHSPFTNTTYPLGWQVQLHSLGLSLTLTPVVPDAEVYLPTMPSRSYWEGEVTVTGERDGQPVSGLGFVEMVGYVGLS